MAEATPTFGHRFLAAVRAASQSAGPWTYAQITRIESVDRNGLATEFDLTCPWLSPSFVALVATADPETLARLFLVELRRRQEELIKDD